MDTILHLGDSGDQVAQLQQALAAKGFSPGAADGQFGNGTEAALLAYQKSEGFTADGVAGPIVLQSLGLYFPPPVPLPSAVAQVTVPVVSQMFPQTPVGNIQANLGAVLQAMVDVNLPDKAMLLMALSTIRAETASFEPISEGISHFNTSPGGHPFDLYDNRKDLGNQGPPDGASFCGRGFVQLTGRANYAHFGTEIGEDLIADPKLCNDPSIASKLLAHFIADKQTAIRAALATNDMAKARSLVNGGTHGLADFTSAYTIGSGLIA
jgi:peptidoglycan L-alanyl-D-glutamate endopeptidase CwlK